MIGTAREKMFNEKVIATGKNATPKKVSQGLERAYKKTLEGAILNK